MHLALESLEARSVAPSYEFRVFSYDRKFRTIPIFAGRLRLPSSFFENLSVPWRCWGSAHTILFLFDAGD